ncbi:MAG: thioredoxin family protein [Labilithrix sp.]|nr:thioredoxin family protein [Labilithrix sp.]
MTVLLNRFGVAVVLSLVALVGCGGGSEKGAKSPGDESSGGEGHAEVGKAAPDLSIQSLNGKGKISLDSTQGKILVVDFWATWCAPCKASFPKLEELSKKVGDKVEVVGISVDDEKTGVLDFAKENGATFAIGWDEGHAIAERWKVKNMPTTFIVDGSGKVRFIHAGYHDGETKEMEKELASLVDEGPSSGTRVAKNSSDESKSDSKSDAKDEPKSDAKSDSKSDAKSDSSASASSDEEKADAPAAPPPKKKGGKKGGKTGGGKATPKKGTKKK